MTDRKELKKGLPMSDALRVRSAEYWLGLGQADEAALELAKVSDLSKKHRWVVRTMVSASRALREMNSGRVSPAQPI